MTTFQRLRRKIERLQKHNLLREDYTITSPQTPVVEKDGQDLICMASNNYLNLTDHPAVREAAGEALRTYGTGSGAARLITGTMPPHRDLEKAISNFKRTEETLVFGSGYATNIGTIPALAGSDTVIFWDELNHASLIDGVRLSDADNHAYDHVDLDHLRNLLETHAEDYRRTLVVTDGVFSMDGDLAPLPDLVDLVRDHDALLMVDDAHGTGVIGDEGRGTLNHYGLAPSDVDVQMGTLSKSLAAQGGFVTGREELIDYLRNHARSFIYSTAPAPSTMAAARKALEVSREADNRRQTIHTHTRRMYRKLSDAGFQLTVDEPRTPILALVIGDVEKTLDFSNRLEQKGILVPAVRPPTVPRGGSRLRISLSAGHSEEHVETASGTIIDVGTSLEIPHE